jgi:hypothetical protein
VGGEMESQKNKKISEMVSDFAGDFISLSEDIQEMQQYLHAAVSAWNIACLDKRDRVRLIKSYMKNYQKMNPDQDKKTYQSVEDDLRKLIKQKINLYPDVDVQIVDARIEMVDGKMHIQVASLNYN